MKKQMLIGLSFILLAIPTSTFGAAPEIGWDIVTECTNIPGISPIYEETVRLRFDDQLSDNFYLQFRNQVHYITNMAYDNIDDSFFDQALIGYKTSGFEAQFGKQWLYLGKGLLADLNIYGIQSTQTVGNWKILEFYSIDAQVADIAFSLKDLNLGVTYKEEVDPYWTNTSNTTWGANFGCPFIVQSTLDYEFVNNVTYSASGYLIQVSKQIDKGVWTFSYRLIDNNAIDPNWSTNYYYANSQGYRLRCDYQIGKHGILTIYQDLAETADTNQPQNISYGGFALYY